MIQNQRWISQFNYKPRGSKGEYAPTMHERAHILLGGFMHSRTLWRCSLELSLLIMSLFPRFIFCRSLHTEAHCSKEPIHESERHRCETQRALLRRERAVSPALTPEGCVWAAPSRRLRPPGSSLFWGWPFTKLPKHAQTDAQLSIATGSDSPNDWSSAVARLNPVPS